jgi:hypothetical protein
MENVPGQRRSVRFENVGQRVVDVRRSVLVGDGFGKGRAKTAEEFRVCN